MNLDNVVQMIKDLLAFDGYLIDKPTKVKCRCLPLRLCYSLYISPINSKLFTDLEGFVEKVHYPDYIVVKPNEIGMLSNFRIIEDNSLIGNEYKIHGYERCCKEG